MDMRFTILPAMILWSALVVPAGAQPRALPALPEEMRKVFFEAVCLTANDTSLARLDLLYRIDKEFLVPFRNPDTSFPAAFRRQGEIQLELLDSAGISRGREIRRIDIGEPSAERLPSDRRWYAGVASFSVPAGRYTISLELADLESERKLLDRDRTAQAAVPRKGSLRNRGLLLLANVPADRTSLLIPQNYGGDVLFGSSGALLFELPGGAPEPTRFAYVLRTVPSPRSDEQAVVIRDTVVAPHLFPGILRLREPPGDTVCYQIGDSDSVANTVVIVPIPLETLPLRSYELRGRIAGGAESLEVTQTFRLVWPDMPSSLRDVDTALEALRFITTPERLDSLKSGTFEGRRDNLEGFWRGKDRTQGTAYNEVMTEYYRRVDHAVRTFGTLREPDGSRTDRGRIYILHGPPAKIERRLDPAAGFREIWTYEIPRKTFVFADQNRSGTYTLISP